MGGHSVRRVPASPPCARPDSRGGAGRTHEWPFRRSGSAPTSPARTCWSARWTTPRPRRRVRAVAQVHQHRTAVRPGERVFETVGDRQIEFPLDLQLIPQERRGHLSQRFVSSDEAIHRDSSGTAPGPLDRSRWVPWVEAWRTFDRQRAVGRARVSGGARLTMRIAPPFASPELRRRPHRLTWTPRRVSERHAERSVDSA